MDQNSQLTKCRTFLERHHTGIIATASLAGDPQSNLINYIMDDKFHIYFMAREGAQKFKNITVNPKTCLVVCDDSFSSSVEVRGITHKVKDGPSTNDKLSKLAAIIKRNNPGPLPILHHPGSEIFLFCLEPRTLTYADFYTSHSNEGEFFEIYV